MYSDSQVKTSWELLRAAGSLLLRNKKFLVFPFLSLISIGGVLATFLFPVILKGNFSSSAIPVVSFNFYFYIFIYFFIESFITIFFNSALISVVHKSISGGRPTIMGGLADSIKHIRPILVFALVTSLVGFILYKIADKFSLFGKVFSIGANLAWNIALFFTLPIIIINNEDIFSSIKKSTILLKKRWGNVLMGNFVIDAGLISISIIVLILFIPLTAFLGISHYTTTALLTGMTGFFLYFLIIFSASIFEVLYSIVLYQYVTTGSVETGFKEEHLKSAFASK